MLIFESIFFVSIPIFYWFLVFFVGNIIYFKIFEEKELIKRFGTDYEDYNNKVSMQSLALIPAFQSLFKIGASKDNPLCIIK